VPAPPFLLLFLDRFKPSSHSAFPQDEEDWEEYDEL